MSRESSKGSASAPVTARDFSWWHETFPFWSTTGATFTLVSEIVAEELLSSLATTQLTAHARGMDELADTTLDLTDTTTVDWPWLIGVADIAERWSLIAEVGGAVGDTYEVLGPLSAGRTIAACWNMPVLGIYRFQWWHDGILRTSFEFPTEPDGLTPHDLDLLLDEVGYPSDPENLDYDPVACALALLARVTGVVLTPDFLRTADFRLGQVRLRPVAVPGTYTADLVANGWRDPSTAAR